VAVFSLLSDIILTGKFEFTPSIITIGFAFVNALLILGFNICLIGASDRGPYSITTIFMLFGGVLVPLLVAVLFMGDKLSILQCAAILFMLAAFYLMNKTDDKEKSAGPIFWVLCILLLICNGSYSAVMDAQQFVCGSGERTEMLVFSYLFLSLFSLIVIFANYKWKLTNVAKTIKQNKTSLLYLILAGLVGGCAQNLLLFLLQKVQTSVLFTINNGGVMLFAIFYSVVLFKEKLNRNKIIGIILAFISLIVFSIA
jgi:drug/metabolite transporter (DMT)-like permease